MAKEENIIQEKSFEFAVRVVNLYRHLTEERKEYVLSKQLLRSGTSIGANVEEAIGGQTRKDFGTKMNIAYKEARETRYWLRLMKATDYLTEKQAESMLLDCEENLKILAAITKTIYQKGNEAGTNS
ncbi:MAG: four helix bundle protein [Bacteroidetes bacterium]|nr:MAG: four helix bundle protein [Bacteroidota bacterium]